LRCLNYRALRSNSKSKAKAHSNRNRNRTAPLRVAQRLTTCRAARSLAASRFFGQAEAKTGTRYKPRLPPQL